MKTNVFFAIFFLVMVACGGDEFEAQWYDSGGSGGAAAGSSGQAGQTGGYAGSAAGFGPVGGEGGFGGSEAGSGGGGGESGSGGAAAGSGGTGGSAGAPAGAGGSAGSGSGGGSGGSSGQSGGAGGSGATPGGMVMLPVGFAIDTREVTRGQYEDWLATSPETTSQPSTCDWNHSFEPDSTCMSSAFICDASQYDCSDYPQACIDWCDAHAYCESQGKRLCGKIGGGYNNYSYFDSLDRSQWFYACTSNGAFDYPYGNTYDNSACSYNMMCHEVGWNASCQSVVPPFSSIRDMSGNVKEWTNECGANYGGSDECMIRGGSFITGSDGILTRCDVIDTEWRSGSHYDVGFRCCWEDL